jgi:hypothetical protein
MLDPIGDLTMSAVRGLHETDDSTVTPDVAVDSDLRELSCRSDSSDSPTDLRQVENQVNWYIPFLLKTSRGPRDSSVDGKHGLTCLLT